MWRIAVKRTMGEGEVEEQDEDLEALHPTVCQAFFCLPKPYMIHCIVFVRLSSMVRNSVPGDKNVWDIPGLDSKRTRKKKHQIPLESSRYITLKMSGTAPGAKTNGFLIPTV